MKRAALCLVCLLGISSIESLAAPSTMPRVAPISEETRVELEKELDKINQRIGELTALRDKALLKAGIAQNNGDRYQFQGGNLIDARRQWKIAEKSKAEAVQYQAQIDELVKKKRGSPCSHTLSCCLVTEVCG